MSNCADVAGTAGTYDGDSTSSGTGTACYDPSDLSTGTKTTYPSASDSKIDTYYCANAHQTMLSNADSDGTITEILSFTC